MTNILVNAGAFILGSLAGSVSGLTLLKQAAFIKPQGPRYVALFPVIRIISTAALIYFLLHWGAIPFILFGVSMMITMWVVILSSS